MKAHRTPPADHRNVIDNRNPQEELIRKYKASLNSSKAKEKEVLY